MNQLFPRLRHRTDRMPQPRQPHRIPLWLKLVYSLFVLVLAPIYFIEHGLGNFLWFSNVALLLTVATLWLESPLLASIVALAVLIPEIGWVVDFLSGALLGVQPIGLTAYMFDPDTPLFVRALSLYHLPLPVLLVWLVHRLGYDRRALAAQTAFGWVILLLTFLLTDPGNNVNWVFGPGLEPQQFMPAWLWLVIVLVLYPLVFYLPTHLVLRRLFA